MTPSRDATAYAARLAAYRWLVAQWTATDPDAAPTAAERARWAAALAHIQAIGRRAAAAEPEHDWHLANSTDQVRAADATARTLAAMADPAFRWCAHLDVDAPAAAAFPATVSLDHCRGVCPRCAGTLTGPRLPADMCDWCHTRDVPQFTSLVLALGPLVVIGNACPACAAALTPAPAPAPKGRG